MTAQKNKETGVVPAALVEDAVSKKKHILSVSVRDWSKSIWGGGGGLEQREGGSSVFEPLVRGGSFNFQLPMG